MLPLLKLLECSKENLPMLRNIPAYTWAYAPRRPISWLVLAVILGTILGSLLIVSSTNIITQSSTYYFFNVGQSN